MCSYNRLNGPYACENRACSTTDPARRLGLQRLRARRLRRRARTRGASLSGGLDFEPWPPIAYQPLLVQRRAGDGASSARHVDEHVRRVLRTLFAYGVLRPRRRTPTTTPRSTSRRTPTWRAADRGVGDHAARRTTAACCRSTPAQPEDDRADRRRRRHASRRGGGSVRGEAVRGSRRVERPTRRRGGRRRRPGQLRRRQRPRRARRRTARSADVAIVFAGDDQTEGGDAAALRSALDCQPATRTR